MIVKCLLAIFGLVETGHQPYSPYHLPANIFLIPKVKSVLDGRRFQDIEDVKMNVND